MGVYSDMQENGYGLPVIDHSYKNGNTYRKGQRPTNAFPLGHRPWNQGMRGLHLSSRTEFQLGDEPANKLSVGIITQRTDGNGTVRNYIKVAEPNVWKTYATYLWEKAGRWVPDGCVLHHINQNALDDRVENFEVLTRSEHALVHRIYANKMNPVTKDSTRRHDQILPHADLVREAAHA